MTLQSKYKSIISGEDRAWYTGLIRLILWAGTFPYRWIINWKNRRFDRGVGVESADAPVISIGNLTTGGTGKTPMVCYIASRLRQLDLRVTILSRGFGANESGVNDEALELEHRLPDVPHLQDPDRKKIADIACTELGTEVLVLDDGFQHRQLHRDIDIVIVDATDPFGHDFLLPRGLLREPVESIRRCDVAVINRCNMVTDERVQEIKQQLRKLHPRLPVALAQTRVDTFIDCRGNDYGIDWAKEKKVIAFSGIGNPEGFKKTLNELKLDVVDFVEFPDHNHYSRDDISRLVELAEQHPECDAILCTHKDLVKVNLPRLGPLDLFAVQISTKITHREKQLWQTINMRMQQPPAFAHGSREVSL